MSCERCVDIRNNPVTVVINHYLKTPESPSGVFFFINPKVGFHPEKAGSSGVFAIPDFACSKKPTLLSMTS